MWNRKSHDPIVKAHPAPFKMDALQRIRMADIPVSEVVDVGVRELTQQLIAAFPDKHHRLFEPVSTFFPDIERNYAATAHTLHPMALSNEDVEAFLVLSSLNEDGKVTHSQINPRPEPVDGMKIIDCQPVAVRRFDNLGIQVQDDFLLKVDVDGLDLQVLEGFGRELSRASVVVVEVTYGTIFARMDHLGKCGFDLFDIVDIVYYGNSFYQADIIMLRRDLRTTAVSPTFNPFIAEAWAPFTRHHVLLKHKP
jgi:FkbM family methyltransferase